MPLTLLPLLLLGLTLFLSPEVRNALARFFSEKLSDEGSHLAGSLVGMLAAYMGGQFVLPSLARLRRMHPTATQVTSRDVGFLRALELDATLTATIHLGLAALIAFIIPFGTEALRIGITAPTVIITLAFAVLVTMAATTLRCPSCRGHLLAQRPTAWLSLETLRDCPFCHYAPNATSDVLESSMPPRGKTIAITCLYLVAAFVGYRLLVPPPPTLPEPGAPPLRQADFAWRHADLQGHWHEAEALRGKPLVLNFMTTTSVSSRRQLPSISALAAAMREHAIVLNLSDEPLSTLQSWASSHPSELPPHHVKPEVRDRFGLSDRPRVVIVDAAGWVRFEESSIRDWDHATVRSYLHRLKSTTATIIDQ